MSEPDKVAIATVLSTLIVVDIVGNSLVCVIIKKNRDLRYVRKTFLNVKHRMFKVGNALNHA